MLKNLFSSRKPASPGKETKTANDVGGFEASSGARSFDLNIEKILEGWETRHAIRELIANALDEEALTRTRGVQIGQQRGRWFIRDYGRGLRYEHFTQNENQEKLDNPDKVIGKFGVGLKDALATLNRHSMKVHIRSRHANVTLDQQSKHGFSDVVTLHAIIAPPMIEAWPGLRLSWMA